MRLKKITLNNFRCFEHLEINLHPRLTIFVGENGAGKTAVLDGVATALSPVLTYLSSANQRLTARGIENGDFRIESWEGKNKKERWEPADFTQLVTETTDGLQWDYWRPSSARKQPPQKYGMAELKELLIKISDSYKTTHPELSPVFAYYGARRGYVKVPERLRGVKVSYDYPPAALVGSLNSMSDFREMLAWFDLEESSELRANKGVLDQDFEESRALTAVRASITALLGGAFQNPHFNKEHKFVLDRKDGGAPMLVSQLSQGYQSMLALAMDFSRRLAIANPHLQHGDAAATAKVFDEIEKLQILDTGFEQLQKAPFQDALALSAPAIMLVDEIDLHLHPAWQQRVLGDLMRCFPLTQFIVTTHSPQVLSAVTRENIRVLRQTESGHEAVIPDFSPLAHESGDALARIMGTNRQPALPILETVREFEQLVRSGQEKSPAAVLLREKLDKVGYQIHESDLATWLFLANRRTQSQG